MRPHCLSCVYKHIASAAVADTEVSLGYPGFLMWVIGNLDHAAQEAIAINSKLAWVIREHRIKRFDSFEYRVPYEALASYVSVCLLSIADQIPRPDVPDSCLEGLDMVNGEPVLSMDTRP